MQGDVRAGLDAPEPSLIDAAVAGDVQALVALYDQQLDRVYRYVYYLVGNRVVAEDLTQKVFLNYWREISRYQHKGASFIAWLIKIAHNEVIDFRQRAGDLNYLDLEPESEEYWADPEAETFAKYDRLMVRRAVRSLEPDQQQVIVMRFVERLDYADIAATLGKSEGSIRVIQHRALTGLRRLLTYQVN